MNKASANFELTKHKPINEPVILDIKEYLKESDNLISRLLKEQNEFILLSIEQALSYQELRFESRAELMRFLISSAHVTSNKENHLFVRLMDQDEPFIEFRFTAPELSIPWRNGQDAIVVTGTLGHITALIK